MSEAGGERMVHGAAEISREELAARLGDPSLAIVNVLPREAFEEARIPGSRSLPLADIPARAREVLPDERQEIAVYCGGPT
jgi:rhodanese-related sulfurtransferase